MRKHHSILILFICALLLGSAFVSTAQEERAETPRTIVSLPTTFASGVSAFYAMPDTGDAIDISAGTPTEASEPTPSCSGGVLGTYSVWFALNHPGGTLDINTAYATGSAYDTVIQVFAYDTQSITDLLEVRCDDDSGGGSAGNDARVNTILGSAPYLVRISCKDLCGGVIDLALSISFIPPIGATPNSNNLAGNQPITFNKAVKVDNIGFASRETLETTDPDLTTCNMYHSVWHRFVAPRSGYFTFSTYGSRLVRAFESQDTKLAVYSSSGGPVFANLTQLGCSDDSYGTLYSVVNGVFISQGTEVYVRVGTFSSANLLAGSQYRIMISPEYMSGLGTNPAFDSGTSGWTLKNTSGSDGVFNDGGDNVFRFFGALNKNAKIKQSVTPSTVLLDKAEEGGAFRMFANYNAVSLSNNAKFILKVTYTDGTPTTKLTYNTLRITAGYQTINLVAPIASKNVNKVSMMFKNSSTSGQIRVDDISLDYAGNPARERKGDGLLPLPAPAWRSGDAATFRGQN
ncbi:MAG: hypothetical protein IPM16_23445 [Chloroflexi bacterium]|nr:hypothetical protein [Chloroflexota bacterium]